MGACYAMGCIYVGKGVAQDFNEAARWYRLAAEEGDERSVRRLALMYLEGELEGKDVRLFAATARKFVERFGFAILGADHRPGLAGRRSDRSLRQRIGAGHGNAHALSYASVAFVFQAFSSILIIIS